MVSERAGGAFDPRLADVFARKASALCGALGRGSLWETVVAAAPEGTIALREDEADAALGAMAEFVDLKSPFTVGHSAGVAELAAAAAQQAGLPTSDVTSVPLFETKMIAGVVGPTAIGWLLFRRAQRRDR